MTNRSRDLDNKEMHIKSVQMSVQGQWTKWSNFVQTDLSWKVMWALPPKLVPFLINSTYDTLPTPSNLKRWGKQDSNACPLCSKSGVDGDSLQIGTTSHILSGCQFSLRNGRYTFRHDNVLSKLKNLLEEAIKDIRPASNPKTKPWWEIKFVPQGHRQPKYKRPSPRSGILHKASAWNIQVDIPSKSLIFPWHIAITELRPDLVIFSNVSKIAILIELTCPCEENFEDRHHEKLTKYNLLKEQIISNGWDCYLYAIEVGARGYCSESVPSCLRSLGLNNKSVSQACKALSLISMKTSFCIWMARELKDWTPPPVSKTTELPAPISHLQDAPSTSDASESTFENPRNSEIKFSVHPLPPSQTSTHSQNKLSSVPKPLQVGLPSGLQNLGLTCYANSILQALLSVPEFSLKCMPEVSARPSFAKAFRLILTLLKSSKVSINPTKFLAELGSLISKEKRRTFKPNKQHDVPEVLSYMLDCLIGKSSFLAEIVTSTFRVRHTCHKCLKERVTDEPLTIIEVPVKDNIQISIDSFHHSELLEGTRAAECKICKEDTETLRESWFSSLPEILFIHLNRFNVDGKTIRKNLDWVDYQNEINVHK